MPKKKLINRIENLFEDLGSEILPEDLLRNEDITETPTAGLLSGWRWSCNSEGLIQECSEDVERILGISYQEWKDQPIYRFSITEDSSVILQSELAKARRDKSSFEQNVTYTGKHGSLVPVKLCVFPVVDEDQDEISQLRGWRGVALVLQTPGKSIETQASPISEQVTNLEAQLLRKVHIEPEESQFTTSPLKPYGSNRYEPTHRIKTGENQSGAVISLPFQLHQQGSGILEIIDENPSRVWSEDELRLVEQVTDQLSLALENAQLFQETQSALAETEALYTISKAATHSLDLDIVLGEMLTEVLRITDFYCGLVSIFNDSKDTLELAVTRNLPEPLLKKLIAQGLNGTLCDWVYRKGELLVIEDNRANAPVDTSGLVRLGLLSYIGAPLVLKGNILGTLCCFDIKPRQTQDISLSFFQATSQQIGIAVENSRLFRFEQRRRQIADTLREIAQVVGSILDVHEVTERMLDQLPNLIDFDNATIQLFMQGKWRLLGSRGLSRSSGRDDGLETAEWINDALVSEAIVTKRPVIVSDTQTDPRWKYTPETTQVNSYIAAPLVAGAEVVGMMVLKNQQKNAYTQETVDLAAAFAVQAAVAIQNARLFEQIQSSLKETNALYRGSMAINSAASFVDVLTAIKDHTFLGEENRMIVLSAFNPEWNGENPIGWLEDLAAIPDSVQSSRTDRYQVESYKKIGKLLETGNPLVIADIDTDERLNEPSRNVLRNQIGGSSILILPLILGSKLIGSISAAFPRAFPYTDVGLRQAMLLGGQAAVAIQNMRLLEETQRRAGQLATAAEIARDTSGTLALDILMYRSVNLIRERYGYYHASIFLLDENSEYAIVRASTGSAGEEMKQRGHGLAVGSTSVIGRVTQSGLPVVLNDVTQSVIHKMNPLLPDTRAEIGLPLKIGNRIIGALDVQSTKVETFTHDEIAVLQVLADQLAVAVDNARSYELAQHAVSETRQRVQELSSLYNVSSSLANARLEISEIAGIITRNLLNITDVDACSVSIYNPETDALTIFADVERKDTAGEGHVENRHVGDVIQLTDHPVIDLVMQTMQPLQINAADPKADGIEVKHIRERGLESVVVLPLAVKGQSIGVILLEDLHDVIRIDPGQMNLLVTLSNASAVALENARLYEEQIDTAEKLRELDKLKSQFLANMSHELRTPLNSIIGFSRVIIKGIDGPVTELQQQDLTAIHNAGNHLLKLINDVLDISKIEAGKMDLSFDDNVNIADLIISAMSTAVGLTKDKPIRLERRIADNLPLLRADPTRIRQVLINFLSNAAKFTDEGIIRVSADVQTSADGIPEMRVSVTDSGPGISIADQGNLFQPFSQVDASPTRKVGGTGLGLSISRMLIELHNGRIGVESDVGQGSTFYFTLPLPYVEPEPEVGNKKVILVIDDSEDDLRLAKRILEEKSNYEVRTAKGGIEGLVEIKRKSPNVIVLDLFMPDFDGFALLKKLREDPSKQDIPVVIFTAGEIDEEQKKRLQEYSVQMLRKSVTSEAEFQGSIEHALNRYV